MRELTYEEIVTPTDIPMRGLITPGVARRLLELNIGNRTISPKTIEAYQREMEKGVFHYTGDVIRLDKDGKLMDGQHRLIASVTANTPFECIIVNNLPRAVMSVIDTGRKRSPSDQLRVRGITNASNVVSAVNMIFSFAADRQNFRATNAEVDEFITAHPQIIESVAKVQHTQARDSAGQPSTLAAIHFIATELLDESQKADEFVHVFATGERFYQGDAAFVAREYLLHSRNRWTRTALKSSTVRAILIRAWNQFRKRKTVTKRPPTSPFEVRIDGFDAAPLGLAHIRDRKPMEITPFLSEDQKRGKSMKTTTRRRARLPLALAPEPTALPAADQPVDDTYTPPDTVTVRVRKRPEMADA